MVMRGDMSCSNRMAFGGFDKDFDGEYVDIREWKGCRARYLKSD